VKSKLGFVSVQGSGDHSRESVRETPDLSGNRWEYWCKTRLDTDSSTRRGDGVLRLGRSIFVRVVWDTECVLERCAIARAEGSQTTAYLEFSRPISTMSGLSEQLARAIAEIEAGLC
jgi:hypothetical protein